MLLDYTIKTTLGLIFALQTEVSVHVALGSVLWFRFWQLNEFLGFLHVFVSHGSSSKAPSASFADTFFILRHAVYVFRHPSEKFVFSKEYHSPGFVWTKLDCLSEQTYTEWSAAWMVSHRFMRGRLFFSCAQFFKNCCSFYEIAGLSADTAAIILRFADAPIPWHIFGENWRLAVFLPRKVGNVAYTLKRERRWNMVMYFECQFEDISTEESSRCRRVFEIDISEFFKIQPVLFQPLENGIVYSFQVWPRNVAQHVKHFEQKFNQHTKICQGQNFAWKVR